MTPPSLNVVRYEVREIEGGTVAAGEFSRPEVARVLSSRKERGNEELWERNDQ